MISVEALALSAPWRRYCLHAEEEAVRGHPLEPWLMILPLPSAVSTSAEPALPCAPGIHAGTLLTGADQHPLVDPLVLLNMLEPLDAVFSHLRQMAFSLRPPRCTTG